MSILVVDFMNMCHRAKSGFLMGPAPVVYNFFRQFKALIDQFEPTQVYVVLEGRPVKRYELLPEYKANRKVKEDDPKYVELQKFFRQKDEIVELLSNNFPVSVVRHETSECDDTIYNLIKKSAAVESWVVVSNDSDFTQLLQEFNHVKVWNPMKKEYVVAPQNYDYVTWKSLRGDDSDNIPGILGIGDKKAAVLASDPDKLLKFLSNPDNANVFLRNHNLISFCSWSTSERMEMTSTSPEKCWTIVKSSFDGHGFKSLTNEVSWAKFTRSFERLWETIYSV